MLVSERCLSVRLVVNVKKTLEQNAQLYFEKAKKARKKIEGAEEALKRTRKKLESLEAESCEDEERLTKQKRARKKEWYEKFRWFFSSEGFLVVGGRDATTNEIIIKKHMDKDDIVFHTDMAGSPFFVVKKNSQKGKDIIGEATIMETANATFAFNSKAWKAGLMSARVFWVMPEQVTKEAQAGEYLQKGAFMIRGKTNYVPVEVDVAIGMTKDDAFMCGSYAAVKANCRKVLKISHGKDKPSDIAKKIRKEFGGGDLDEIIRVLPSGNMGLKI